MKEQIKNKTTEVIIEKILKEPLLEHTATNLAKELKITRQAVWKALKKLSHENFIILKSIAETKKSANKVSLNFKNPLLDKTLSLILIKESLNYERWVENFSLLKNDSYFIILFGSVLIDSKKANDIDIIIVSKKEKFKKIDALIAKIQKTQAKKVHFIDLTEEEFNKELLNQNKAYLDALKKGIILSGQDNFIKFITNLKR